MSFVPPPGAPTIVELATELWGEPNKAQSTRHEIRFGSRGSKRVKPAENIWKDEEGGGGGYVDLWKLARPNEKLPNGGNGKLAWEDDILATYDYPTPDGRLIQVVRTISGNPRFRQRQPDGPGKWKWSVKNIPGHNCLLYRLAELRAAPKDRTVWICAGEKDTDRLRKAGLTATTNIGGEGKWREPYNEEFRDRPCVALQDNDEPGTKHVATVARSIHGIAASVKVLLLPNLPPKGDVSNFLDAGNTIEELLRLADANPTFQPPFDSSFDPFGDPAPGEDEPPPLWEADHPANDEALPSDEAITEQTVMRAFVALYCDRLRFNHDSKSWFVWNGHYWQADRRQLAFAWALDLCRARSLSATVQKVRFSSAVEQGARAMPPLSTAQEDWDLQPMLLGTPEGVVELKTGLLRPGRPEDMITRVTAVAPAETPDCPRWLGFLDYAFSGNQQNVCFLQRYFGYCLTGLVVEEFFIFLFGEEGTGKGTATTTVRGILGAYADVVPIEMFTSRDWRPVEYYRARLPGRRLIIASKPARDTYWSEAFVNEITGGDQLSGRHPAGRPFDFMPTHKPLLHGNHLPRLKGAATGLKRRLGILPFNHPPEKPDRGLKAALRDEWPAILRWMIEGCLAWQKRGLDPPDDVIMANAAYFAAQDTLARWIEDRCILDPNLQLEPAVLRRSFNEWAKASGEETMSEHDFSQAIERFKGWRLTQFRSNGKRWIRGLGLKAQTDPRWEHDL